MSEALARATAASTPERFDEAASLSHLAVVLAHRLRGLVSGIEGYTDLLIDSLPTRDQRDLALRILESAVQIERVLADLQRYSQPITPVLYRTGLRAVIDDLLVAVDDAELERIRLDVQTKGEVVFIADPILLRQALLVLLQNALDATRHEGGVVFRVRHGAAVGGVLFEVQNDGVIALPDAEAQVFMPFYTTKPHNLGVGLSIARRIVQAHGGTLELAANSPETGVCFALRLPLPEARPDAGTASA